MPAVGETWSDTTMKARDRLPRGAFRWRLTPRSARIAPTGSSGKFAAWLTTVDHKKIGILYIGTSLFFFVLGGILSLFMRAQLATPNESFVTRDSYNELFTIHGTTMVFLVVVPILAGFGNFLVPLMIGARDMAFPRLNAFSYWMFLFGGIVLYASFFAKGGPADTGWTAYVPLSENQYSPGNGQDLWILSLHILAISSLAGAINFIATIHNMRDARDDLDADAAVRLGDRGLRRAADRDPPRHRRRPRPPAPRPAGGHALLHPGRGRERPPLPAHLLVLRRTRRCTS